jgi:beta-glucosidase-like glycosyl hydrolase
MKRRITTLIFCFLSPALFAQFSSIDINKINDYVDNVNIRDSIGQLFMVGLPTDIAQYNHDGVINEMVKNLGIGWFEISTYNYYWNERKYPTEDDLLSAIRSFYNYMQSFSRGSNIKIPIGYAANFEGERVTSINTLLIQAPEALTLSQSNDNNLIEEAGEIVGYQLKNIGIQVLLGPVLDIDSIANREYVTIIQNRTFGGTPDIVAKAASQYLLGIKRNGIIAIGKHYPGYGGVLENAHNSIIPESKISVDNLDNSLYQYRVLEKNLDGIMTSHISMNIVGQNEKKIVTFSSLLTENIIRGTGYTEFEKGRVCRLNYSDKVVMTDDLSDMGAIRKYMEDNSINWTNVVTQAFESGHDMFIFSSIEKNRGDKQFNKHGDFCIDDLKVIINNLTNYIEADPKRVKHYRESLKRVLLMKAKIAKNRNQNVDDFLKGNTDHWMINVDDISNLKTITLNGKKENINDIVKKITDESMTKINEENSYLITRNDGMALIDCYVCSNGCDAFKQKLIPEYPKARIIENPLIKSVEEFNILFEKLRESIIKSDKVIFTVATIDDAKLVSAIIEQYPKESQQKLIVFLHNTPTILDSSDIQKVTVLGSYSYQKQSFYSDIDVLLGNIMPNDKKNIPINIGPDGSVYDCKMNKSRITLADGYTVLPYYATTLEKELTKKNEQKMNFIIVLIIINIVLFVILFWYFVIKTTTIISAANNSPIFKNILGFIGKNIRKIITIIGIDGLIFGIAFYIGIGVYTINGSPDLYKAYTDSIPVLTIFIDKPLYTYLGLSIVCLLTMTIATLGILNRKIGNSIMSFITKRD